MVRSRVVCSIGVPLYAKLADPQLRGQHSVTFQVLTNLNCGFKGL